MINYSSLFNALIWSYKWWWN